MGLKFIPKPKCKRDIKSWQAYRKWYLGFTEYWIPYRYDGLNEKGQHILTRCNYTDSRGSFHPLPNVASTLE